MEKTIMIDGNSTKFKCTGGFLIRYKQLTGRDPFRDIMSMVDGADLKNSETIDLSKIDTEVILV